MKKRKLVIAGISIFSVVVLLAIFVLIWFWGDTYKDFTDFNESVEIPGLDEGAVPQGMSNYTTGYTYTDENGKEASSIQEYIFISAYMKEGPSRLYVTGRRTGYVGYVTLKNEDGTDYYGHAGGVATNCKASEKNGTLWVVSDGTVYCAKRSSDRYTNIAEEVIARAAKTDGENVIQFTASFKANNEASFCFFYDDGTASVTNDKLYVGEFYREQNYPTNELHHITTGNGVMQYAYVYEYTSNTSADNEYGLAKITATDVAEENRVPRINNIYSIPAQIQGFARTANGSLVLSQSYGLPNSHLYYYNWSDITSASNRSRYTALTGENFAYEGVYYNPRGNQDPVQYTDSSLYVYFIDGTKVLRDYSIPAMSEGLCVNNDRVYVLFESGCYKYKMFVRQQLKHVYYFVPRV